MLDASRPTVTPHPIGSTGRRPSPYFLEKLLEIRVGDAVSGRVWRNVCNLNSEQADAMSHIDRCTEALRTSLMLLQASETCRRRQPEDFGIGDDLHEGLLFGARELTSALRTHIEVLEGAGWMRGNAGIADRHREPSVLG